MREIAATIGNALDATEPSDCARAAASFATRPRIRTVSVLVLCVSALMLVLSFATSHHNRTVFGIGLGADWLAFYDAATIVNTRGPDHLYDLHLQSQLYHRNLPGERRDACLPYANAPFLALLLGPLATVPYAWSYASWIVMSMLMFVAAIMIAWRAAGLPERDLGLGLLACLSFEPLAIECIHGGQVSAIGMLLLCGAIYLHLSRRPLLAGVVLSGCIYKPTLLVIVLPMLLLSRQWRMLIGFGCGVACLSSACVAAMGVRPCSDYVRTLVAYIGRSAAPASQTIFRTWKFVDLNSFMKLLGLSPPLVGVLLVLTGIIALQCGFTISKSRGPNPLAWAGALTMTLVLNVYVGIYDTVLVLPALLLTLAVVKQDESGHLRPIFRLLCALVYILPWFSQLVARETGYQPYTLALMLLTFFQYRLLLRPGTVSSDNTKVPCMIPTIHPV